MADSNGQWACLGHPDIVLSFSQVNDDICDCPDGSDEPGTAACPGNVFHCANVGHISGKLPSNRVNDGVCDYDVCCDGSDEAGLASTNPTAPKCENRCKEINAVYVAERKKRAAVVKAGLKVRDELVRKAAKMKEQVKDDLKAGEEKVAKLEQQIEQGETKLAALRAAAGTAGENEAAAAPEEIVKAQAVVESLAEKYAQALNVIAQYQAELASYESVLSTMKTEYNPNFNDPAVKAAIRSFEEMQANKDSGRDAVVEGLNEGSKQFGEVVPQLASYRPPSNTGKSASSGSILPVYVQEQLANAKYWLIENGILADTEFDPLGLSSGSGSGSGASSPEITVLQNLVNKHNGELEQAKNAVEGYKRDLEQGESIYGRDDVLRALKDTCVTNVVGEYTYEFCFGGQASQRGNGQNTSLGKFSSVEHTDGGKLRLNYERGAKCWSGPIRRASVELECGAESAIVQVSEPERCEYFLKVTSPVACSGEEGAGAGADEGGSHDEL